MSNNTAIQPGSARAISRAALTAVLCAMMIAPQTLMADPVLPQPVQATPLTQQQKVLHALDRLTFGPRPGDAEAVTKMGLARWFDLQLHPERIDDAALDTRLAQFPAMRLSEAQLALRFPPPQMIRQITRQGGSTPSDPVQHAIYADAVYNYEIQKKQQEQSAAAGGQSSDPMMTPGMAAKPAGDPDTDSLLQEMAGVADGKGKGRRAAQAMDPSEVTAILALPPEQRFARLVAMSPEQAAQFRAGLRPLQRVQFVQGFTPEQLESVQAMQGPVRVVGAEAMESRLVRDVYSERQLQAVMADFWLNHFNVYIRKSQNEPYLLPGYMRDTVLPNALGRFEDLLIATAKSPAMLMYLDNWESIGPDSQAASRVKRVQQALPNGKIAQALPKGINENYARELMELHTLGVNGGYTQQDVIEVAKCFTGWTIDKPYRVGQGGSGGFIYEPNRHEPGAKTVLGQRIEESGENEGLQVLHILASSPATAHFVSQKLAVRFVSDDPPSALVDAMAATFLKSGGDIKAVLTTMFHAPEFWSPQVYRAKVKTPLEFMTSALRASNAEVNNPLPLVQAMNRLGMPIYGMQTPNGYSWKAQEWVSSNALIARMNFSLVLSGDRLPGTRTDWPALLGDPNAAMAAPAAGTEKRLEVLLLGQPAAEKTRETVLAQAANPTAQQQAEANFNGRGPDDGGQSMVLRVGGRKGGGAGQDFQANRPETPLDTMAGLLLGSPEFQRR